MLTPDHQAARRYLANLTPAKRRALRHLLTCPACRHLTEEIEILEPIRTALAPCSSSPPAAPGADAEPAQLEPGDASPGPPAAQSRSVAAHGPVPAAAPAAETNLLGQVMPRLFRVLVAEPLPALAAGAEPAGARPGTARSRVVCGLVLKLYDLASDHERARLAASRQLLADLLMLPPALRRARIRHDIAYHHPHLVRLLLIRANSLLTEPPGLGQLPRADDAPRSPLALRAEAAELAVAVADELPPPPGAAVHPLLADALALAGRAWTQLGAERRAANHFARLTAAAPGLPAAVRARPCHGLAQLRQRQARFDEAVALFSRAAELWAAAGDAQSSALARAQLGFALLDAGAADAADTELAAARALQIAHVQLDPRLPALSSRITSALSYCLAALGFSDRADELLCRTTARAAADAAHAADPAEGVARLWWRARTEAIDGDPAAAEVALEDVLAEVLQHGNLGEAARASLDLAQVRLALGRSADLAALGRDLLRTFAPRDPLQAGRVAALFQLPPGQPPAPIDVTAAAIDPAATRAATAKTLDAAAIVQIRAALWQVERQARRRDARQAPPYIRDLSVLAELHLAAEPGR